MARPQIVVSPAVRRIVLKAVAGFASKDNTRLAVVMIAVLLSMIAVALIDGGG